MEEGLFKNPNRLHRGCYPVPITFPSPKVNQKSN